MQDHGGRKQARAEDQLPLFLLLVRFVVLPVCIRPVPVPVPVMMLMPVLMAVFVMLMMAVAAAAAQLEMRLVLVLVVIVVMVMVRMMAGFLFYLFRDFVFRFSDVFFSVHGGSFAKHMLNCSYVHRQYSPPDDGCQEAD